MGVLGVVTLSACGLDSTYICLSDAQCNDGNQAGRCEPDGYCSFQDDECSSGRRYGTWAPTALAQACVDSSAAPTTAGTSTEEPPTTTTTFEASSTGVGTTTLGSTDTTGGSSSSSSGDKSSESSSSGSTDVPDPDLIAWYRFDSIEENMVADHSGNDHVASCEACPTILDGVYGGAIETDGAGQHLVVANTPTLATQTWTLAAWVFSEAPPSTFVTVVGKPLGVGVANSYEMGMSLAGTNTRVAAGWSSTSASQGLSLTLPASQEWFHVAATLSDTSATLYLDGEVVDQEAVTVVPSFDDSDLYIGADVDNLTVENFLAGRIDDLRIYRRALTEDEVAVIMNGENL